jgi:hypothetical protein
MGPMRLKRKNLTGALILGMTLTLGGTGCEPIDDAQDDDELSLETEEVERALTANGPQIVDEAKTWLGVPYVYGGNSRSGIDCSGLVQQVYRHFGYSLKRTADEQSAMGTSVDKKDLYQGDIICFDWGHNGYVDHVGIYIGDNQMIHAPKPGEVVRIQNINTNYYNKGFATARRIIPKIEETDQITVVMTIGSNIYSVNGHEYQMDIAPEIVNERTFVPVRFLMEAFKADVNWKVHTIPYDITYGVATILFEGKTIELYPDGYPESLLVWRPASDARVNGNWTKIDPNDPDVAPYIKNDRTMIPVRFVAETFGFIVAWDQNKKQVSIKKRA